MATEKAYWVGTGVLVIGDVEVRFGDEIPVIKGFDVAPFLKSGKASHTKPAIESEVVKGLEERFIALRAENERLSAELAELAEEALDRPAVGEEVEALRAELAELQDALGTAVLPAELEDVKAELEKSTQENTTLRQELDDAKAMIAALTAPPTAPEVPAIPTIPAGPKGGK